MGRIGCKRVALLGACVIAGLASCETTTDLAPRVDTLGPVAVHLSSQLELGRHIYITTCARCHSPEAVAAYTRAEWSSILPRMFEQTLLTEPEEVALHAYVSRFASDS